MILQVEKIRSIVLEQPIGIILYQVSSYINKIFGARVAQIAPFVSMLATVNNGTIGSLDASNT